MLARLQQVTTSGLVLVALAWLGYFVSTSAVWAIAGALLIIFSYAIFMGIEFVVLWSVNRGDPTPRASVMQHITAWWGEVTVAPRVFCWQQPFRANAVPDSLTQATKRRGVVFIHGYLCNRGLWNPQMRILRDIGVPYIAVTLEPVFGSIDRYGDIVDQAVTQITSETGLTPVIVAHSMGGLAVRAWLDQRQSDARVHRVITIASPHHGTFLARYALSTNGKQMRPVNDWRTQLASREPRRRFERFTCFYGNCDNVVFPASTGMLDGSDNRHIAGVAHVRMAYHEVVFSEVLVWLGLSTRGARHD